MNIRCAVLNPDSSIQTNEENLGHIQQFLVLVIVIFALQL